MTENKHIRIFDSLSGVEKRACTKFLKSPYFNNRQDVLALWEFLLSAGAERSMEELHAGIYPKTRFSESKMRHLFSMLNARIEAFLTQRALEQLPLLHDLHLLPVLREKGLKKAVKSVGRRAEESLSQMPDSRDFHYWSYRLEWEKYAETQGQTRTTENNLSSIGSALDTFYIIERLRLGCLIESHKAVFNVEYDSGPTPFLLDYIESSKIGSEPVVDLYFRCYKALAERGEEDFRLFRNALEKQSGKMDFAESQTLLLLAVNFCIRQLNSGQGMYIREAFELYRMGLETRTLLVGNTISRFAFKNIVALGLRLEKYDWVEQFILSKGELLEAGYQQAHINYNLARLYFVRNQFELAMPLLASVDEGDLLLNMDSRIMLLKMYYESGEWDALDALISSFRVLLLRKKKVIGYHQSYYLKMLKYIQKLVRLNKNDKIAKTQLIGEIAGDAQIIEKDWLLKQLE
ncbi:MAG: hypothetical protein R2792_01665 [Saprospiraceae bacterium]